LIYTKKASRPEPRLAAETGGRTKLMPAGVAGNVTRSRIFAFSLPLSPASGIVVLAEKNNLSRARGVA
jgi:hypothetical protein